MSPIKPKQVNAQQAIFQLTYCSHRLISDVANFAGLYNVNLTNTINERVDEWHAHFESVNSALLTLACSTNSNLAKSRLSSIMEHLHETKEFVDMFLDSAIEHVIDTYAPYVLESSENPLKSYVQELWSELSLLEEMKDELHSSSEYLLAQKKLRRRVAASFANFRAELSSLKSFVQPNLRYYWLLGVFLNVWRVKYLVEPKTCDVQRVRYQVFFQRILDKCAIPNVVHSPLPSNPVKDFLKWLDERPAKILEEIPKIASAQFPTYASSTTEVGDIAWFKFEPLQQSSEPDVSVSLVSNTGHQREAESDPIKLFDVEIEVPKGHEEAILRALVSKDADNPVQLEELARLILTDEEHKVFATSMGKKNCPVMKRISPLISRIRKAIKVSLNLQETDPIIVSKGKRNQRPTTWMLNRSKIQSEMDRNCPRFNPNESHTLSNINQA